jgi:prepilin-type N-terminal cleavage/methylation domain-containing protein
MKKQQGFTLVEMAVSITIIGLLLVGTLGGVDMIKAGRLRKAASEFTNYKASIDQFYSEYQYLPGDMPIAYPNYWSTASNGDGDGLIDWSASALREDLYAWQHLGLAGLVTGSYTGVSAPVDNTAGYVSGTNAPASEGIKGGVYLIGGPSAAAIFGVNGIQIRLAAISTASPYSPYATGFGVMTGKDAYSIDKKIDDGKPGTGQLYAMNVNDSGTNCVNYASTVDIRSGNIAAYCLSTACAASKDCHLIYWYKKF